MKLTNTRNSTLAFLLIFMALFLTSCSRKKKSSTDETVKTVVEVEEKETSLTVDHLEAFYAKETFEVDAKTNRPEPTAPSERLYKYVEDNYKIDFRVRKVLSHYFLDFHAACLKNRILNYKTEGKNLVEAFVRYEFGEDGNFKKSPSLDYIRAKIAKRGKWLDADGKTNDKLTRNRELYVRYLEKATR